MINFLLFMSGAVLGSLVMAMVIVAGNYDEREERDYDDRNQT